jgi:glycosyltransferase involved in cell wall biosynthesis
MELIDFSKNEDSISKQAHIESVLLYGNPDAVPDAQITICIPTYKRPQLLKEAIESAINQVTDIPYRIIVVDNDSDFGNSEVLDVVKLFNSENFAYYKNKENLQLFGNLNRCAVLAKTKYFALLHDDDLLLNNYICVVSKILNKYKERIHGLCNGYEHKNYPFPYNNRGLIKFLRFIAKIDRAIFRIAKIPVSINILFGNGMAGAPTCGMLFKRLSFLITGGFNSVYFPSSDWFFLIYYTNKYGFYKYRLPLGIYRWGVNETLNVLDKFPPLKKQAFLALKNLNKICGLISFFFRHDLDLILERRSTTVGAKTSKLYTVFSLFYAYIMRAV